MHKLFLLFSLTLIAPVCTAATPSKKVRFDSQPQVRTFKSNEPVVTSNIKEIKESKPTIRIRVGNGLLGAAMLVAGPFAIAMGIEVGKRNTSGFVSPNGILSSAAVISGLTVLVAGVEKIKKAIWV